MNAAKLKSLPTSGAQQLQGSILRPEACDDPKMSGIIVAPYSLLTLCGLYYNFMSLFSSTTKLRLLEEELYGYKDRQITVAPAIKMHKHTLHP